jgi:hypothetical protein
MPEQVQLAKNIEMLSGGRVDSINAAKYLGLSVKTLAIMRCKGTGPEFMKRGRIFYSVKDLEIWMEQIKAKSTHASVLIKKQEEAEAAIK